MLSKSPFIQWQKADSTTSLPEAFHRYSTDEAWTIPHFEKMADDNAWLLRNYIDAYSVFGDEYFRETAEGIINFVKNVLSDAEGGFLCVAGC